MRFKKIFLSKSVRTTLVVVVVLLAVTSVLWRSYIRRSTTITLGDYDLTYAIDWGGILGMTEAFRFSRGPLSIFGASSGDLEIWKKPYNAGVTLYVVPDGSRYFLGSNFVDFVFEPKTGRLTKKCDLGPLPLTALGNRLRRTRDSSERDAIDPISHVLEATPETIGAPPTEPPASKYYSGLNYIGSFKLIYRDPKSSQGDDVGFVPPSKAPEPRFGLDYKCG
ncbi:MAG TPA: hypothetical protein VIF40_05990 [Methylosinus sp.]|jgi:hypothetical protein|uniref:hypothetical protein n=1 Tax=Methylosinus sp. TaxID=427 RepID=UPI002F958E7C